MSLLKKKVQELPSLDALIERLEDIAETNVTLMSMAGLQESAVATTVGTVSTLNTTVDTLEEHNDAFEMAIDAANMKIGMSTD